MQPTALSDCAVNTSAERRRPPQPQGPKNWHLLGVAENDPFWQKPHIL
jgi:hypothetical protein